MGGCGSTEHKKGVREDEVSTPCCGSSRQSEVGARAAAARARGADMAPRTVLKAACVAPGAAQQRELGYVLKFSACMDNQEAQESGGFLTAGGGVCTNAWCVIMDCRRPGMSLENCSWVDVVTNHRLQVRAWGKSAAIGSKQQKMEYGMTYGQYMRLTVSRPEMHLSDVPFSVDNCFVPAKEQTDRRRALLISNEYHLAPTMKERDVQGQIVEGKIGKDGKRVGCHSMQGKTVPPLLGTHNDMAKIKKWLVEQEGWDPKAILHLRDDEERKPTKEETLRAFAWLTDGAGDGDSLWFSYAGHGVEVEERGHHTELNGLDEAMVCADGELIIDDVIHEQLVEKVPRRAQLTCLFDCCHSGTMCDLPYFVLIEGSKLWHREHGEDLLKEHEGKCTSPPADDDAMPPKQTSMPRAPSAGAEGEALSSEMFSQRGKAGQTVDNSQVQSSSTRLKKQREARLSAEAGK